MTRGIRSRGSLRLSQWIDNLEEVIKFLGEQKNKIEVPIFLIVLLDYADIFPGHRGQDGLGTDLGLRS